MTGRVPLPAEGELIGTTYVLPVRVYYEDTDAGGIVYHANYLRYAERARTEMLRAIGIDLNRLREEQDMVFVLFRGEIDYLRPARFDDRLLVESTLTALTGATAVIAQAIWRIGADDRRETKTAMFQAHVACMRSSGRPARFPKDLRARMESLIRQAPPPTAAEASSKSRTG